MYVCKYLPTHTHTYKWISACLCMRAVAGRPKQHKLRDEPQQGSCHRPSTTTKKTEPDEIYNPAHPTIKYPTSSFPSWITFVFVIQLDCNWEKANNCFLFLLTCTNSYTPFSVDERYNSLSLVYSLGLGRAAMQTVIHQQGPQYGQPMPTFIWAAYERLSAQTYSATHTSRACRVHTLLTMAERLNAYTLSHARTPDCSLPLCSPSASLSRLAACVAARPFKQWPIH